MRPFLKGFLALTAAFALTARGAAAFCPPKAAEHACCGKTASAPPKTPCREMSCCRSAPAAVAPASPFGDDAVSFHAAVLPARPLAVSYAAPARCDAGPPGPRVPSVSDRSPPALLG